MRASKITAKKAKQDNNARASKITAKKAKRKKVKQASYLEAKHAKEQGRPRTDGGFGVKRRRTSKEEKRRRLLDFNTPVLFDGGGKSQSTTQSAIELARSKYDRIWHRSRSKPSSWEQMRAIPGIINTIYDYHAGGDYASMLLRSRKVLTEDVPTYKELKRGDFGIAELFRENPPTPQELRLHREKGKRPKPRVLDADKADRIESLRRFRQRHTFEPSTNDDWQQQNDDWKLEGTLLPMPPSDSVLTHWLGLRAAERDQRVHYVPPHGAYDPTHQDYDPMMPWIQPHTPHTREFGFPN